MSDVREALYRVNRRLPAAAADGEAEPKPIAVFDFGFHPFREILHPLDAVFVEIDTGCFKRLARLCPCCTDMLCELGAVFFDMKSRNCSTCIPSGASTVARSFFVAPRTLIKYSHESFVIIAFSA